MHGHDAKGKDRLVTKSRIALRRQLVCWLMALAVGVLPALVLGWDGLDPSRVRSAERPSVTLDTELLIVGDASPVRVSGRGFVACADREVHISWMFQIVSPGQAVQQRRISTTPVLIGQDGTLEAELPPLSEFPGAWKAIVYYSGDCVEPGAAAWLATVPVALRVGSVATNEVGLELPSKIAGHNPSVLVYPAARLQPGFVLPDERERYSSPQDKLLEGVTIQVNGRTCFPSSGTTQVAGDGSVLFFLGLPGQPAECGVEGAVVSYLIGSGEGQVEAISKAEVRSGIVQPMVLIPPAPGIPYPQSQSAVTIDDSPRDVSEEELPSVDESVPDSAVRRDVGSGLLTVLLVVLLPTLVLISAAWLFVGNRDRN